MMGEQVTISIIVPIYNAEKYLDKCLSSITAQSFDNMEIILIDDGSTDSSLQICREYAKCDGRVKVFTWKNHGLVAARRKGISLSHGDYFMFADADDYIDKDAVSVLFQKIEGKPDIVAFGLLEEYPDKSITQKNVFASGNYDRSAIETRIFPQMISSGIFFSFGLLPNLVCKIIRREFYESAILHISNIVTIGEDADLSYQLMMQASSAQIIELYPYHYCKREDSMMWSGTNAKAIEALENDLRMTALELKLSDVFNKQLDDYILFVRLLKNPQSVLQIRRMFESNERIALYGAGGFGQALYAAYQDKIILWSDEKFALYKEKELPVVSPEELYIRAEEYDVVFVSILNGNVSENVKELLRKKLKGAKTVRDIKQMIEI